MTCTINDDDDDAVIESPPQPLHVSFPCPTFTCLSPAHHQMTEVEEECAGSEESGSKLPNDKNGVEEISFGNWTILVPESRTQHKFKRYKMSVQLIVTMHGQIMSAA